jgi:hypothetical protein
MTERSKSEDGSDSAGEMHPKEPSQAQLDADRKANPDHSKQVDGVERDGGGA